ncbi:unnamed protein product [Moneuplotes crassus]|uniref:Uncharacterized protein n=1 Tax=Euplotes crassus TaxID=5936 RepID=A0AAD1UMU2_EUPCR|nr:unnamed protein product [Moneuplotes crassus]
MRSYDYLAKSKVNLLRKFWPQRPFRDKSLAQILKSSKRYCNYSSNKLHSVASLRNNSITVSIDEAEFKKPEKHSAISRIIYRNKRYITQNQVSTREAPREEQVESLRANGKGKKMFRKLLYEMSEFLPRIKKTFKKEVTLHTSRFEARNKELAKKV